MLYGDDGDDDIARATQLLSVFMFCRRQAQELHSCDERRGGCERQRAAFETCCHEHLGQVVQALVKIADHSCPAEVAAYRECKSRSIGSDCEREDLAAVRCASRAVLESASMDERGGAT